jgi:oxaloacetate decarboxylase alpha subunit
VTEIRFVDTTLRDGHLSLWASNMTTGMMLPVAERIDRAGFVAMELISGAHFKKAIRELKDDPFERVRLVAKRTPNTPLRLIAGAVNIFGIDPPSMYRLFLERLAAAGISQARISDPWNNPEGWRRRVEMNAAAGIEPIINLIYSVSPRHTDEHFVERVEAAARLPVKYLCFKDPGGLLTPESTARLAPLVLRHAGKMQVEFHTHCTTGLGPLCAIEAIKAGITVINTAIPPLANGASNPSVYNVAANARALGYRTAVDEDLLHAVTDHFTSIARHEGFPIGRPLEYDVAQYHHQVPGGMISNLGHQLRLVGKGDRIEEALEETARVRAELGYPIMVTPLSQFVGSQAAINIITGERYREVTDQTIDYALGRFGKEAVEAMDPEVRAKILDRPRARELERTEPHLPTLQEMRDKYGGAGVSDEEMLLRWITSKAEVDAMHAAGAPKEYRSARQPLVAMVESLSKRTGTERIHVGKPGFSLTMEKRAR